MPPRYRDRALVGLHLFYEVGALGSTGLALLLLPDSCKAGTRCGRPKVREVSTYYTPLLHRVAALPSALTTTLYYTPLLHPLTTPPYYYTPYYCRCEWPLYLALVAAPAAVVSLLAARYLPESPA